MKKILLTLSCCLLSCISMLAAESTITFTVTSGSGTTIDGLPTTSSNAVSNWSLTADDEVSYSFTSSYVYKTTNYAYLMMNGTNKAYIKLPEFSDKVVKSIELKTTSTSAGTGTLKISTTSSGSDICDKNVSITNGKVTDETWEINEKTPGGTYYVIAGTKNVQLASIAITVADDESDKTPVNLSFSETEVYANLFDEITPPTLLSDLEGVNVAYSSENEDVAMVDESTGEIVLMGEGTTVITATYAGDDTHASASAEYTLIVTDDRTTPIITFPQDSYTVADVTSFEAPTATVDPADLKITYTSSNEDLALVDDESGYVVLSADVSGTATITASFAGDKTYKPASASYQIIVGNGKAVIKALTATYSGDAAIVVTAPEVASQSKVTAEIPAVATLEISSGVNSDGFIRWYKDATLTLTPAEGIAITEVKIVCGNNKYGTITLNSKDITTSASSTTADFTDLYLTSATTASNSAQIRFSYIEIAYEAAREQVEPVTFNVENESTVDVGSAVTLTSATEGATILYKVNDAEEWTEGDTITFSEVGTYTIVAKATKDGMLDSAETTATYTVDEASAINAVDATNAPGCELFDLQGRKVTSGRIASGIYVQRTSDGRGTLIRK